MENQIHGTSWSDLPQDIVGIIFGKLLEDPGNLIRGRAVCKNWRIARDRIPCKDRLPSLCYVSEADDGPPYHIECTIFDPYGRHLFQRLAHEYVEFRKSKVLGSKQGWLICSAGYRGIDYSLFMYNPHSQEIIPLPLINFTPRFATFSTLDCQVFVFCYCHPGWDDFDYIASYCLTVGKEWSFSTLEMTQSECRGMQYINEQLYCLFDNGSLKRYSLADGSWTLISRNSLNSDGRLSLIKGEDDVLVVCKIGNDDVCSTFYFDWSNMCWVAKDLLESSAIFICSRTAMIRPFVGNGENAKDCRVFYFDDGLSCHCKCYSFIQKSLIETPEYDGIIKGYIDAMAFVENIQEFSLDFCFQ